MKIQRVEVGYLKENCYVVSANKECLIIDPGAEKEKIKRVIKDNKVLAILVTHYHFDHVGALEELKKEYNVNVIDYKSLKNQNVGPFSFEIIDTKGHKEDAVSFYFKTNNVMFVGDFIFKGSIGRCDLLGGDFKAMISSLNKIKGYDKNMLIYPGHGDQTTLGQELLFNEYLRGDNYE